MKFRMVDRILAWDSRRNIRGTKAVSFEEYRLKEVFGESPHLPQTLVMESLFQLGNWLIMLSSDFSRMGLIVRFQEIRFHGTLRPGGKLRMEAAVRSYRDDGIVFDGRAWDEGQPIVEGKACLVVPVELAAYHNPDDLRVLFSEIYRPGQS